MAEKKPVYNGYEERYLNGAELKTLFNGHYYATGRHHSVILGLAIPDYLDLLKINESKEYRIFINEYFCRVMDGTTDRLISFFGYNSVERIDLSVDLSAVEIPNICTACGAPMKFKEGKYGEFLGCSRYPNCKQTTKIPIIGNSKKL